MGNVGLISSTVLVARSASTWTGKEAFSYGEHLLFGDTAFLHSFSGPKEASELALHCRGLNHVSQIDDDPGILRSLGIRPAKCWLRSFQGVWVEGVAVAW